MDYVVITSSKGVENLESLIKENISLGWQPLGGVTAINALRQIHQTHLLVKPVTLCPGNGFIRLIIRFQDYEK